MVVHVDQKVEMDRHQFIQKNAGFIKGIGLLVVLVIVGTALTAGFFIFTRSHGENKKTQGMETQPVAHLTEHFLSSLEMFQQKVESISHALEENERLKLENANLRNWSETLRFNCAASDARSQTQKIGLRLTQETGRIVGRTLASINYRPPSHLLPPQLYVLAASYFKGEEFEKSAVILTFLTGLEDNKAYKTAKNYVLTAVSWYRLDHFKLADEYFDYVLQFPAVPENLQYQAQARLWKSLIAKRSGQTELSQHWLHELIDHHPHSMEAVWVNSMGAEDREPASSEDE